VRVVEPLSAEQKVEHPERGDLLHSAVVYSVASVGWGLVSGVSGVVFGILEHSVALTAFGLGASIDSLASVVLVRRFELERREPDRAEVLEHAGLRIVGRLLLAAAVYVIAMAIRTLVSEPGRGSFLVPAIIAGTSAVVLHVLGRRKLSIARGLGSRALRADGVLSLLGSVLSISIVIGFALEAAFGWRWVDAVAALIVAAALLREGFVAITASHPPESA
jgi:divalent metal cation (Fe/Co/Zn/Cd) transporter